MRDFYGKRIENKQTNILLENAFRQFQAPLYFYAIKFVGNSEVAKDLVQDAFLGLLKTDDFDEVENLKSYLFQTVRNNCLNHIKHNEIESKFTQKEQERALREVRFYDTHKSLVEKELQQKLMEAIDELPEKYKIPFQLSRFEELKSKEIAEKLNLPIRTVETQIYRALKLLKEKIYVKGFFLFSFFFQNK